MNFNKNFPPDIGDWRWNIMSINNMMHMIPKGSIGGISALFSNDKKFILLIYTRTGDSVSMT